MTSPQDPLQELHSRVIHRETGLGSAAIIHPAGPVFLALARRLAAAVHQHTGVTPPCHVDTALMPERSIPLPAALRSRPMILLGGLNTNRALQPLYANYLCSTDATYPGGDGYDLRTIVNPYGTGANVILAGGSSPAGAARAVDLLISRLSALPPRAPLPFQLAVDLAPALAASLAAWPFTPLEDSAEQQALRSRDLMFYIENVRVIGAYTLMWTWTADERYIRIAADALRRLNAGMANGYGDWHYLAERFMRAIPHLAASGFLTDAEIRRTDELLLLTALGNANEWWRMRRGDPPLGHRHHGKGTYEFLLLARYLHDQCQLSPALRTRCAAWIGECHAFLDGLAAAQIDDQDDESTLNNLATLYRYALGEEQHSFFTSGAARLVAQRCLALHDNNGNGAGQGGYGESQGMYLQQEATEQVACCAFYYGAGELKWILHKLPNLAVPQRYFFLRYSPVFLQKYDTGPELASVAPPPARGLTCLPVTDHQFRISNHPPEHVEPHGHMVNAPETWQLPEGVGLNRLPQARGFDKLVLRGGYERADAYLMIQGYQGGFRWQGHMQAANGIVRFYQHGHVWLVQNTSRHSPYDKNGLLISDGADATPVPPIAERVATADFPSAALTVTRLPDCHHTAWTRHLFWSKAGDYFVCLDHVAFQAGGNYSLTCTWRTPGYAELDGRHWRSEQGAHRFTLVAGADLASTCEVDTDQGACSPYCLRQRHAGDFAAGAGFVFANLFAVRPLDTPARFDLRLLDPHCALVRIGDTTQAWCAIRVNAETSWLPGARLEADSVLVEAASISAAGTRLLQLPGRLCTVQCAQPLGLRLDLRTGTLLLQAESPASVRVTIGDATTEQAVAGELSLPLPADRCAALTAALRAWLDALPAERLAPLAPAPAPLPPLAAQTLWRFDSGTRVPEVLRHLRISADPLPVNGSPEEMLDPVMPDGYSRETWIQWPVAPEYHITLALPAPRPITALNLLGDCLDDPSLRTFHPLPDGITVTAETADGATSDFVFAPAPDRPYKRYRDSENRLQQRTARLAGSFRQLRIRVPAPSDGRPFILHRLEVCGDRAVAPPVEHWLAADLDGDGRLEIAFTNARHELIVVGADGRERWRAAFTTNLTHVSAQPLDPQGPPVLCAGLLGGDFLTFQPDGALRARWPVGQQMRARRDSLQGWFNATNSAAVWWRDARGRGCLVLGGYGTLAFLNADGEVLGHSFSDGPWNRDILVAPATRPDAGDLFVRCGWNHGIMCYPHVPGGGPSGQAYHFGGFNQPMFRMLDRVIPFANGRSLAAQWITPQGGRDGALFFATELGCGVLSPTAKDWLWKREGGMSLNACALGAVDGLPVALTAGMDGFVSAVNLTDGHVVRKRHVGQPALGVNPALDGGLLVTTSTGLLRLDPAWAVTACHPGAFLRALPAAQNFLLLHRADHTLELLELPAI